MLGSLMVLAVVVSKVGEMQLLMLWVVQVIGLGGLDLMVFRAAQVYEIVALLPLCDLLMLLP